jgi:hypothetical protein
MAHRAKHRHAALLRRVGAKHKIKSDDTPEGKARWKKAKAELRAKKPVESGH